MQSALTAEQIDTLKRDGALALPRFFSAEESLAMRSAVQRHFGDPSTPQAWRAALVGTKSSSFDKSLLPVPQRHRKLAALFESCLRAGDGWQGWNEIVVRAPEPPGQPWLGAHGPHLDFPYTGLESAHPVRTLVHFVIYLNDVGERGGPFMYWPRSHRVVWEHFRQFPLDLYGRGEHGQAATLALIQAKLAGEAVPFTGSAGDMLVWNSLLFHSASCNHEAAPRLAVFGRWGTASERGRPHYDFERDVWSYWNFAPPRHEIGVGPVETRCP